jgi:hypothetical protein
MEEDIIKKRNRFLNSKVKWSLSMDKIKIPGENKRKNLFMNRMLDGII